jgi:hypothetical protein
VKTILKSADRQTLVVRHWLFTVGARDYFCVISCEIRGQRSGIRASASPSSIGFSLQMNIPPLLGTRLSLPLEVCCRADQTAQYHTRSHKFGPSSPTRHFAHYKVIKFSLKGEVRWT